MSAAILTSTIKPRDHVVLGDLPVFTQDTLNYMLDIRQYGDLVRTMFGPFVVFFANHPDVFHDVLVNNADHYDKSMITKRTLKPVIGTGLFTSEGQFWKRQRRLSQPAFHSKRISAYADTMVDYANRLITDWSDEAVIDLDHAMADLTMHIVTKALFNVEMGADAGAIGGSVTRVLEIVNVRLNRLMPTPGWLPIPENRDFHAAIATLDRLIQAMIDERRHSGRDAGDLLSMLLLAQDEDGGFMTDQQLRDEAMTIFGAGHETTAVALTWTFYLLSQHPEVEARLLAELDAVLGDRLPTFADLSQLKYTEMVVKEAMRLYPPAWGTTREANRDTIIGSTPVRKGQGVVINIWGVHRDSRFFPQPDHFSPERFSPENEKTLPKYAYLPFGAGPRVCIGNQFAMMEAKLILATIAPRIALRLLPGQVVVPERVFTLRPRNGMKMIAARRDQTTMPQTAEGVSGM